MPTDAQGRAILIAQGEDTVLSCDDTVHTETPFASPLKSPASERDRYERLREEAARHGTQMLEEEKEETARELPPGCGGQDLVCLPAPEALNVDKSLRPGTTAGLNKLTTVLTLKTEAADVGLLLH